MFFVNKFGDYPFKKEQSDLDIALENNVYYENYYKFFLLC